MRLTATIHLCCLIVAAFMATDVLAGPGEYRVGVAKIDITPDYPVRLSGFGGRRAESEGVSQRIFAKALAIETDEGPPVVLITVDNVGVSEELTTEVAKHLKEKAGIERSRMAIAASHTHSAPMLSGMLPTLFGVPIPPEHQQHIDRYTRELTEKLEEVALAALNDRQPARLSWAVGTVRFAINRRTVGGPVDHDLPMLAVKDLQGKLRAVWVNYACHCVTLSANRISGDWAGYAQEAIEARHPDAIALVAIGCGADANPNSGVTGERNEIAATQGREIAQEVDRLLGLPLTRLGGKIEAKLDRLELPLAELPSREQFDELAKRADAVGYHARVQLGKLDRGEELRTAVPYSIQTWLFGDDLAVLFMPGEVVVDYALRLKREFDFRRLWINAFSNDSPCYIPSERILREGGYEGRDAMIYYDQPAHFRPGLEKMIIDTVHRQIPEPFKSAYDGSRIQGAGPLSPHQSLATITTHDDLVVELVAAEPLVVDPVAIDFGPDGRLWVAEMYDYPQGADGNFQPGGRIKVLEDTDADGRYDRGAVFLDGIPFPTGVTVWRQGVLVCAAPDILYAEDTDGDGRADLVRKLFSGFGTENYQARVNSLTYGLDNWIYGSCGLYGGEITSAAGDHVALGNRDFRIKPDTGVMEPATGTTQQGRVRDDWGNWFGCDNGSLIHHYPVVDHYVRRNPHIAPPSPRVGVADYPNSNRLYPLCADPQRFALSGPIDTVTSACGIGIYRDNLLGPAYSGNSFTCESVYLAVHRLTLSPRGTTFSARRPAEEVDKEFLSSTDKWFRPVQARTGPDGALWLVDMYRYVIEHPIWIPPEDLAKVDVRAGHTMGRLYRIYRKDKRPRPLLRLDRLDTPGLVAALETPNGPQRDLAQQMLIHRGDRQAVPLLEKMVRQSELPMARLHALCTLDGLDALSADIVARALADTHPGVRRHAVRLSESLLPNSPELGRALLALIDDGDPQVQLQLAYSLGQWNDRSAGRALATLAIKHQDDPYLLAAVLSSVNQSNIGTVLTDVLAGRQGADTSHRATERLLGLAAALAQRDVLSDVLTAITPDDQGQFASWQMASLAEVLDGLDRRARPLAELLSDEALQHTARMIAQARLAAADEEVPEAKRLTALRILGRHLDNRADDILTLGQLLVPQNSTTLQAAAVAALGRIDHPDVPERLLDGWNSHSPALQSQILDVLISRDGWLRELLGRMEDGDVLSSHIDATRRQRLLDHRDEQIRTLAEKLLAGATNPDRKKVLEEYNSVLSMAGDAARGKVAFAKHCSICHLQDGEGYEVGPDLGTATDTSPQGMLLNTLDPNQAVLSKYIEYTASTDAGRIFTGILAEETATSITLKGQEDKKHVILRSELDELYSAGKSIMPEGLEKDISKQDMADLLAYLGQLGPPPKQMPGNSPELVKPNGDGVLALLASNCEVYGDSIVFEPQLGDIGMWHGAEDHVVWAIEIQQQGRYEVHLDFACADYSAGNAFVLEGIDPPIRGIVPGTGAWSNYHRKVIGTATLPAGRQRLTFHPDGPLTRPALLDLKAVTLIPLD